MKYKVGFLGGGNIAKAIIGGFINSGLYKTEHIIASARSEKTIRELQSRFGIAATLDNALIVQQSEIVIIAVKPYMIDAVITPLRTLFTDNHIVISVAAGVSTQTLKQYFDDPVKLYRVMPNTPAQVGAGMSVIFTDVSEDEPSCQTVKKLFESVGLVEVLNESLVHACIAVQGSSPAYMFMMLEAMGDAGVKLGLPRDKAYLMAAQTMLGSAQMLLETKMHPGALKDMVTSPGGTTIEAVAKLEESGFRHGVIKAMVACADVSETMSKK
ncbi:pyrroline-5-carboxylate reductase [Fusibacter paucivorans]|uniref:Pyrroline-5-carboxylate reductase n=1 Tax=Fusibacter paucivorans TaxID=76009 RepID=A0ABS5PPX3_9FIRM|nr:pyrroline-5-carboxylate reductase [Fusibacter paucivorans]MBS7526636.1 pyrroline-5-carboxylate reductase [Fusibacter paucivorans]